MAASIFTIFDDIAALMDDVSVAAKVATEKTAGILGDDLAVNAEKATGFLASREIPVLWKITKGSLLNKAIIVPIIFLLQWIFPSVITIILIIGGFYLAYEGMEKIIHAIKHKRSAEPAIVAKEQLSHEELLKEEGSKVKGAILTDFILSIEIVIIALSTVMGEPIEVQIVSVIIVSIIATIGVYGIVALIVRMDDAGYKLIRRSKNEGWKAMIGRTLVKGLPFIIKSLTIIGTIALFMVSGGIFVHNIHFLHDILPGLPSKLKELLVAVIAGSIVLLLIAAVKKMNPKKNIDPR